MRRLALAAIAFAAVAAATAADAKILITIDKSTQRMTVSVDGATRWSWPVSTGRRGHATPNGSFQAFRMERDHFSREWDDAPMPHSIFFTKRGHAIHGSFQTRQIGTPASAGCVRLAPEHARELFALVEERGVLTATVVISGEEPRASAPAVAKQTPRTTPQQTLPQQTAPRLVQPRTARRLPQYDDEIDYVDPRSARPRYQPPSAYRQPQPGYEHLPPPPPGYMYAPPPAPPAGYHYYYR